MHTFGASFSYKYCVEMGVNPRECFMAAIKNLDVKRLRLMSYWDVHESKKGIFDFTDLDWQMNLAERNNVEVSLCLGLRQPRWPESHWPEWARSLPTNEWHEALMTYIARVVTRYKSYKCIKSYQLENEALLKTFGQYGDFDPSRLNKELELVKRLDSTRPVVMSTSDSYGIPFRAPRPDVYAFSIYRYFYDKGTYRHSSRPPVFYRARAHMIRALTGRKVFIHELQAEPWGPTGTSKLSVTEQYKSMNLDRVKQAVEFAQKSKLLPADLWGLEWWYWLMVVKHKPEIWNYVTTVFTNDVE